MGSSILDPYVPGPGEVFYPLFNADSPRNVGKTRRAGISNSAKHNAQPWLFVLRFEESHAVPERHE